MAGSSTPVRWGPAERRLMAHARASGDDRALDGLFEQMLPLARGLAFEHRWPHEPVEDPLQVASLALFAALKRFDPDRGVDFPCFARPTIAGELKRYRRDFCWHAHVPRGPKEHALEVRRHVDALASELNRRPTPSELAERSRLSVAEVLEALRAWEACFATSLDDESDAARPAIGASEDPGFQRVEERHALRYALRGLPRRQQRILALRFLADLPLQEITSRTGISQRHVSRLLAQAVARAELALAG